MEEHCLLFLISHYLIIFDLFILNFRMLMPVDVRNFDFFELRKRPPSGDHDQWHCAGWHRATGHRDLERARIAVETPDGAQRCPALTPSQPGIDFGKAATALEPPSQQHPSTTTPEKG